MASVTPASAWRKTVSGHALYLRDRGNALATVEPDAQHWHVAHSDAGRAVGELAVSLQVDRGAGGGLAFELLAGDRDRGATAGKLALALA